MIREEFKSRDIQDCIVELMDSWGAPWNRWTVIHGWPDVPLDGDFGPYVYGMLPEESDRITMQGGERPLRLWNMTIGFWLHRSGGGEDELSVWTSGMQYKFDNPGVNGNLFTVTLGTTTYSNTTLKTQGISVQRVSRPSAEMGQEKREFRKEMDLLIKA